jgi:hypothetical protein
MDMRQDPWASLTAIMQVSSFSVVAASTDAICKHPISRIYIIHTCAGSEWKLCAEHTFREAIAGPREYISVGYQNVDAVHQASLRLRIGPTARLLEGYGLKPANQKHIVVRRKPR